MSFDFGVLQPYVDNPKITDIDSNSKTVYITDDKGKRKVMNLEPNTLKEILGRLCNHPDINDEFNFHKPILDGTLEGLRIHAVHDTVMKPEVWLSIRRNPIDLVVKEKNYKKIFELLRVANQCRWSYAFGGERGSGKTQFMRSAIELLEECFSITILADNDEMHMLECLPDRLIAQYIVNDIVDYEMAAKSVLRDNSDYVIFQEVRDKAIDDLLLLLSSCSRVMTTLHVKSALLMPQRMVQLSRQKNDEHLLSTIHDYMQMCIVPIAKEEHGKMKRYIGEIALFWNDENGTPQKQLIYEDNGDNPTFYELPDYYKEILAKNDITLNWKE